MQALKPKPTHANVHATQGPNYGGGYRATVFAGKRALSSQHFPVPASHRNAANVLAGVDLAYAAMKKWLASWGLQ